MIMIGPAIKLLSVKCVMQRLIFLHSHKRGFTDVSCKHLILIMMWFSRGVG